MLVIVTTHLALLHIVAPPALRSRPVTLQLAEDYIDDEYDDGLSVLTARAAVNASLFLRFPTSCILTVGLDRLAA